MTLANLPADVRERIMAGAWAEAKARIVAAKMTGAKGWRGWLHDNFPAYVRADFAQRHIDLWEWVWSIEAGARPRPFVGLWPRGGGKSTSAELASTALGLRQKRKYALYTCETQDQADRHVSTIGSQLETIGIERAINKYGNSRGWRRNRLWTSGGFVVDALGLDTASRGIKAEEKRPDLIVLDDIDGRHDTPAATDKKQETLTQTVLPTGTGDCAVLAVQNIVHRDSIFERLSKSMPPFLSDRLVSGPFPALTNFQYEYDPAQERYMILSGVPTWEGQGIIECENAMNTWGVIAFRREAQHDLGDAEGSLWKSTQIEKYRVAEAPPMARVIVAIDPSASSKNTSDECGIIVAGVGFDQHAYVLADYSQVATPSGWARAALKSYQRHQADHVYGEGNNGGEMVETVIGLVGKEIEISAPYSMVWASRGKETRAEPTSTRYEEGRVHHVGTLPELEAEMCSWVPNKGKSPNRVDALVWAVTALDIPSASGLIAW